MRRSFTEMARRLATPTAGTAWRMMTRQMCSPLAVASASEAAAKQTAASALPRSHGALKVLTEERFQQRDAAREAKMEPLIDPAAPELCFAPSFTRRAKRERLQQALAACAEGHPFEMPKAQLRAVPGPGGAVMNVLRELGPIRTDPLYDAVQERYPGVLRSKRHLKKMILERTLVNSVQKIRHGGSDFKDHWAVRYVGQTRMRIARLLQTPGKYKWGRNNK